MSTPTKAVSMQRSRCAVAVLGLALQACVAVPVVALSAVSAASAPN